MYTSLLEIRDCWTSKRVAQRLIRLRLTAVFIKSTANMAHCTLSDSPLPRQMSGLCSDTSVVQTSQVRTATSLALLGTTNQKPRSWDDVNLKFLQRELGKQL
jgi:hypothetical protein